MYEITAVFNKSVLVDVLEEFESVGIAGVTIVDVIDKNVILQGCRANAVPKVMVKVVVSNDEYKDIAMEAIRANTMGLGSGKMWLKDVSHVERMRTGEKDADALTNKTGICCDNSTLGTYYELDTPST